MMFLFYFFLFLFLILAMFLCLLVLIQESKSLGLGASFGGDASSSFFGTSTAEVLKKATAYMAIVFIVSCVVLSLWTNSLGKVEKQVPIQIEEVQEKA